MGVRLVGEWKIAQQAMNELPQRVRMATELSATSVMRGTESWIQQAYRGEGAPSAFARRGWSQPRPAKITLAARRFRKENPSSSTISLRDTNKIATAVKAKRKSRTQFVVRLTPRRSRTGRLYTLIAEDLEFGREFTFEMSPKMRRFLHWLYRKAGIERTEPKKGQQGVIRVVIPPRPIWGPAGEALAQNAFVPGGGGKFPELSFLAPFAQSLRAFTRLR